MQRKQSRAHKEQTRMDSAPEESSHTVALSVVGTDRKLEQNSEKNLTKAAWYGAEAYTVVASSQLAEVNANDEREKRKRLECKRGICHGSMTNSLLVCWFLVGIESK